MSDALDTGAAQRVVLDLRQAPGGGYHPSLPLVAALAAEERIDRPDRLAVIFGRNSASATAALVSRLEQDTQATLIGEPTPARPNTFLDPVSFTLPNSGITYYIPSTVVTIAGSDDHRDAVYPDIHVPLLSTDVLAGHDRALEVALAAR
jgi:C-terminal processing protease CtpA/Prc